MRAELNTLIDFDQQAADGDLRMVVVTSLNLTAYRPELANCPVAGAMFLGCQLPQGSEPDLLSRGALIFPRLPEAPVDVYRGSLYRAIDLFDTEHYADSFDARAYRWASTVSEPTPVEHTLITSLHDHAIGEALDDYLAKQPPAVGVMGGHAWLRGSPEYAAAAHLGAALQRAGKLVVTGGGPGAMEAANLGARLGPHEPTALPIALELLRQAPDFHVDIDAWVQTAREVRQRFAGGGDSLGIPTWFYGHEPPGAFASRIAKFFSNAIREDILLRRCTAGLVFLPGAAGTVQELFQAATANYYSDGPLTPLVLVDREHWTQLPAWELLSSLAQGRPMGSAIALVADVNEALDWLGQWWGRAG